MDLIRSILLTVEADDEMDGGCYKSYDEPDFPGHSEAEIAYHVRLLQQQRLVEGDDGTSTSGPTISKLTWLGHEFIAATKDPDVWQRVKERVKTVTDVAFPVLLELGKDEIKKKLGL